jgi:hypothetical protein
VVPVDCCLVVDDPVEEMCLIVPVLAFRQRQTSKSLIVCWARLDYGYSQTKGKTTFVRIV